MPDREYYVDPSPAHGRASARSTRPTSRRCSSSRRSPDADAQAARVFELERTIAAGPREPRGLGGRQEGQQPLDARATSTRSAPGLDWNELPRGGGPRRAAEIFVVWQPGAVTGIAALVASEPLETWKDYLDVPRDRAPRGRAAEGVRRGALRVPRHGALRHAAAARPLEARGRRDQRRARRGRRQALRREVLPAGGQGARQAMVREHAGRVRTPHRRASTGWRRRRRRRPRPSWRCSKVGVGYPDSWRDYSGLEIVRGDALGNAQRAELFEYQRSLRKLGKPVDRGEWVMTPQTVNAVNLPVHERDELPGRDPAAAVLRSRAAGGDGLRRDRRRHRPRDQPQLRRPGRAVRRRRAGCATGGRPRTSTHFQAAGGAARGAVRRLQAVPRPARQRQADAQREHRRRGGPRRGVRRLPAVARRPAGAGRGRPHRRPAVLPELRADLARQVRASRALRQQVLADGHAPDEYRADTVRNLDAWYDAFDVKPGEKLYLAPADRVRVW